ncbi:hypothetical protein L915_18931 [Phytophthora nicotianae]|uniref:No apical meristem-associated C-terminal domain-containing protein n=1 Tax=Phytophthora nicotianae TaxID=4792 RepID=W2FU63_PHYNI|nr:hypothetical protein L915_18931 [Phytophthora nicotianae]
MSKAKGCERDEENHLFQAQVNITEGQAIGTDKSMTTFCERVHRAFVDLEGGTTARNANALQTHWPTTIRPDVTLYASLHTIWSIIAAGQMKTMHMRGHFASQQEEQANENALHDARFMRCVAAPRKRQIQREDSAGSRASDDGSSTEVSSDEHGGESSVSTGDISSLVGAFDRPRGACKKRAKLELVEAAGDRAAAQAQQDLATAVTAQVTVMKLQLAVSKRKLQILQEQS